MFSAPIATSCSFSARRTSVDIGAPEPASATTSTRPVRSEPRNFCTRQRLPRPWIFTRRGSVAN